MPFTDALVSASPLPSEAVRLHGATSPRSIAGVVSELEAAVSGTPRSVIWALGAEHPTTSTTSQRSLIWRPCAGWPKRLRVQADRVLTCRFDAIHRGIRLAQQVRGFGRVIRE